MLCISQQLEVKRWGMCLFVFCSYMYILSVKSCHSCCSKTVLEGSAAMSSGKQPDPDLGAEGQRGAQCFSSFS